MKKWLKILSIILAFALISFLIFLILKHFNMTNISTIKSLISKSGKWGIAVYIIILVLMLTLLCFVPLLNVTLTILGITLFGSNIAFVANMIAIFFSTSILFFIGDKLGEKWVIKLIGEKSFYETQNLIDHKSKFWLPILFIAPVVPDEAICLVAGMTKIKYWYLMLVSLLYHAFEIGLLSFIGSGLIDWSMLTLFDWILFINVIIIDIYLLIKFEKYLDKKLKK